MTPVTAGLGILAYYESQRSRYSMLTGQRLFSISIIAMIGVVFFTLVAVGTETVDGAIVAPTQTAPVYAWQQPITGDWQSPSSWAPVRMSPAASDILVFNTGGTTTATNVPTQTIGQLIVTGNTTVNLQSSAAIVLTMTGGDGDDLIVERNSALNFTGANAIAADLVTGVTAGIGGSMTFSSSGTAAHRITAVDAGAIAFNRPAVFTAGAGFTGNPFGTTNLNSVIFVGGSTYVCIDGGDPFGAAEPASVVVFKTGSLFSLQGDIVPSFSGRTYGNFEMNYSPGYIFVYGSSALIMDDLTITAGILALSLTGTPGHSIRGRYYDHAGVPVRVSSTLSRSNHKSEWGSPSNND